ncbi:MAG TPA: hypothetical protein PK325_00325 [Cyclobacteriaceae bacterium]|nr:hypothetical protein [Cyclobacteriaceae bacterium]HMV07673.1 hypothetical protein [Cyclobacteriaceae bacterium]HMV88474.1 hypothetical protein [Cyclobacteriaceae bacterium]HMW98808.1 hypothetical protein [Cyclobacteriaceae bacterium]HMX48559.1 hypothetical protein [Cyclobacteriaceae bacterium]
MRRGVFLGIILMLSGMAFAGNGANSGFPVDSYLKAFLTSSDCNSQSVQAFDSFLNRLDRKSKSAKSERAFVRHIFNKTHQQFLKQYAAFATLDETFEKGSYNCLTGTILLSLALHHYNIAHEVIETNYHIFIVAETREGQILLEATDSQNGFVTSQQDIETRIATYKQNKIQAQQTDKSYYKFQFELYNTVTIDELRGLSFYNKAVDSFNHGKLEAAASDLVKANALYSSFRTEEFSQILLLSLQQSELDTKTKENCMHAILSSKQKSLAAFVAAN